MTQSSESPTASPDVIGIAAPLLFGPLFNWALYGVLTVQIYVYSYNFPKDRLSLKFIAYFIFLLETIQTVLTGTDVYCCPLDNPIITAVVSLIVQGYFCYRIWRLNRWSSWICWIIAAAAVTQSAAAMEAGIKSLVLGGKYVNANTARSLYLWSISTAIADILIAVAMTLLLRRASDRFSSFVLIRVVRLTIETNFLTASLAVTILVLYATFPNKLYYVFVTEIIGKVYSNTLLLNLNNRIYFREHQLPEHEDSADVTTPDRVRATVQSLHTDRFVVPEAQPRTPISDSSHLSAVTQTVELGKGRGDNTSFNSESSPSCPTNCHLLPDNPE